MVNVTCWGWSGVARDEGDAASAWLSDFLGRPVRLVRYAGALPVQTLPPGRQHGFIIAALLGRRCSHNALSFLGKPERLVCYAGVVPQASLSKPIKLT